MLDQLLEKPKNLYISSYFAAKRFVIDDARKYNNPYPYVIGLVLRATDNIINVDIDHQCRKDGESGYTLTKLLSLWFNGFTSFSVKPLRISIVIGLLFAFFGFISAIFIIINKILNPNILIGWTSLMAIVLISSGILMIILGLVGEYVGRAFISLNNSPQFVVKEEINMEDNCKDNLAKYTKEKL